ncbi:hypothetical protein IE077_000949 [Cardiosporidium cionae]|uniref:Uncharacterized protein n=1 Tax=Cardiosporidium cionae TaxID=476202 RepID=A0ABQ7JDS5_9APIC|nr:hypothetical protein IE077_000949 [Cardiosporidium cionae]|eukprot:KAF8822136.1 hypothetical protein IE077_000949 [Cardiosporidium cionae]
MQLSLLLPLLRKKTMKQGKKPIDAEKLRISDPECLEVIALLNRVATASDFSDQQVRCLQLPDDIATYDTLTDVCINTKKDNQGNTRHFLNLDCVGRNLCTSSYKAFSQCWLEHHSHEMCVEESRNFCRCITNTLSDFLVSMSPAFHQSHQLKPYTTNQGKN